MREGRGAVPAESGGAGNNNFAISGRPSSGLVGGVVTGSVIAIWTPDALKKNSTILWSRDMILVR